MSVEKIPIKFSQVDGERRRMKEILRILKQNYPDAECSLNFASPFQLLVATVLSAQCTDERVNQVTPDLFKKFPTPQKMAKASLKELEELVRSAGFYKNKARSLLEASQTLVSEYEGNIPRELEKLVQLRGVGRKTANVVLGVAFGIPGMVVDTHVGRLSRRLGFTQSSDPVKIEQELMGWVEREEWTLYAHLMIFHGRKICTARKAHCEICPVSRLCPQIGVNR